MKTFKELFENFIKLCGLKEDEIFSSLTVTKFENIKKMEISDIKYPYFNAFLTTFQWRNEVASVYFYYILNLKWFIFLFYSCPNLCKQKNFIDSFYSLHEYLGAERFKINLAIDPNSEEHLLLDELEKLAFICEKYMHKEGLTEYTKARHDSFFNFIKKCKNETNNG